MELEVTRYGQRLRAVTPARWVPGWSSVTTRRCAACRGDGGRHVFGWISCDACEGYGDERLVCVVCFDRATSAYEIGPAGECLGCCRVCGADDPGVCRCALPHPVAPQFLPEDEQYRAMGG